MLELLLLELVSCYKLQSYFVSLLLTSLRISSADDTSDLSTISTISKNYWSLNFHCHTRFYQKKCIQMSTNKPSIGPVKGENKEWRTRGYIMHIVHCTKWPLVHIIYNGTRGHFKLTRAYVCAEWVKYIIIAENLIFLLQYTGATFISKVSLR